MRECSRCTPRAAAGRRRSCRRPGWRRRDRRERPRAARQRRRRARARPQGDRRPPGRQGRQRLGDRGQRLRPDHRLHEHGLGRDLQPALRAALLLRARRHAAAERRRGAARRERRRPRLHDPAAPRRLLPPRPQGHGRRLQVLVGAAARPQARELGVELHLLRQGREQALRPQGQVARGRARSSTTTRCASRSRRPTSRSCTP